MAVNVLILHVVNRSSAVVLTSCLELVSVVQSLRVRM